MADIDGACPIWKCNFEIGLVCHPLRERIGRHAAICLTARRLPSAPEPINHSRRFNVAPEAPHSAYGGPMKEPRHWQRCKVRVACFAFTGE